MATGRAVGLADTGVSRQLHRALLAVQGRHRPTLEDMALADRLAAHVLAERHGGREPEPGRAACGDQRLAG